MLPSSDETNALVTEKMFFPEEILNQTQLVFSNVIDPINIFSSIIRQEKQTLTYGKYLLVYNT